MGVSEPDPPVRRSWERRTPGVSGPLGEPPGPGWQHVYLLMRVGGLVAIVVGQAASSPGYAVSGAGLVLAICAAAGAGGWSLWIRSRNNARGLTVGLGLMALAGGIGAGDRGGPIDAFGFLAAFGAGVALETAPAVAVALLAALSRAITALVVGAGVGEAAVSAAIALGLAATLLGGMSRRQRLLRLDEAELLLARTQMAREEHARAAALDERARIAREIHDVLAHSLSALSVRLAAARLLLAVEGERERALAEVDHASRLARDGLEEARRAVAALRDDGPAPVQTIAALVAERDGAVLQVEGSPRRLEPEAELALVRVAQEALTNAAKHAAGAEVQVVLRFGPDVVEVVVEDKGGASRVQRTGLRSSGGGHGLVGMRERAELIGGSLTAGPAGAGWRVALRVPA